jgi:hypothetical protein
VKRAGTESWSSGLPSTVSKTIAASGPERSWMLKSSIGTLGVSDLR